MTPIEHYRVAEALLSRAKDWSKHVEITDDSVVRVLKEAQVHATLATVPDAQYRPEARVK